LLKIPALCRAFVLQVIGFGCNVPSILGTRVIRDRGMRLLSMLVIPFALCQARLTVFLFMADVFCPRPWRAPGLVVFGFYVLSFVAVVITGLLFKRAYPSQEAFVLELCRAAVAPSPMGSAGCSSRCWRRSA
jgi:ferrous iron transport protein B